MSKPYTETDFTDQLTVDRTWRIKEISDLKNAISRGDMLLQQVLLRALVTICYAHWEGYARFTARKYLEHIALRKFKFSELNRQFFKNYFLSRLGALSYSSFSIVDRCKLIDEILNSSELQYKRIDGELINTKSNLTFEVFSDICLVCGVPIDIFEDKSIFINKRLLKRRNEIAHGEEARVALTEMNEIADTTIELMRDFGNALENLVVTKNYRAA